MVWFRLSSLLAFVLLATAKPLSKRWTDDFTVKHAWTEVPKGWESLGRAPADHVFPMRIALKQHKLGQLIEELYEVSDPTHERYGKHLSKEDVEALVQPHSNSVELVGEWLASHGISSEEISRSPAGDWITVTVTVSQAERMLDSTYDLYQHVDTTNGPTTAVRTLSYSLPHELHSHVDLVAPTTMFGGLKRMKKTSFLQPEITPLDSDSKAPKSNAVPPSSCATTITPSCLRTLYNTANYTPKATSKNSLGVAGYLEEFANRADLQTFFQKFRTDAVGSSFTTTTVNNGGDDQTDPGVEANLDIQYTTGISFPTPNIYYSTGGSPPFTPDSNTPTNTNEPYLDWVTFILAQSSIPQTITTSYGDDEQTVPLDFATRVCNDFAQLGARGTTLLFSSGDDGVGAGDCKTNDGKNTTLFQPNFPASCPFVTTVGGTTKVNPEVAVSFSGGGFSRYFAQPSYQKAAVSAFLTLNNGKNAALFNASGRAYPDVAAQGNGFQVVIGGRTSSVGGTSASSPTVAGVIALLNDERIAAGKSSLGFLNPLIYANASTGFNDITSGTNPGCNTNGFSAGKGWDAVTGLGTPDFTKLVSLIG